MSRHSLRSKVKGYIVLGMIFYPLASMTIDVNGYFVQDIYAKGFENKNLSNHSEKKIEYALTSSSENYFAFNYVKSGGQPGNIKKPSEKISYDSKTNELSGNFGFESFTMTLSDRDVENSKGNVTNLEGIMQSEEFLATKRVYPPPNKNAINLFNYTLTVTLDGNEHRSTWTDRSNIPNVLTTIKDIFTTIKNETRNIAYNNQTA